MTFHVNHDELPEVDEYTSKEEIVSDFDEIVENLNDAYDKLDSAMGTAGDIGQENLKRALGYISDEIAEAITEAEKRANSAKRELEDDEPESEAEDELQ